MVQVYFVVPVLPINIYCTCPKLKYDYVVPVPSIDVYSASSQLLPGESPGQPGCKVQLLLYLRCIQSTRNIIIKLRKNQLCLI